MINKDNEDNIYHMFKDINGAKYIAEPKINKPNFDWDAFEKFMELNQYDSLRENIKKKKDKPAFDLVKLENRLISLLDAVEGLLEYLEDRRHNQKDF